MDEKELQALYEAMGKKLGLGDFNSFKTQIESDDKFRKAFYQEASTELDLGDYGTFDQRVKKKPFSNDTPTPLESGLSNGQADGEIPIVSLDAPEQRDAIELSREHNQLSNAEIYPSEEEMGRTMGAAKPYPDEAKRKKANDLKEFLSIEKGVDDPEKIYEETKDLTPTDFGKKGFYKEQLLADRDENYNYYLRKIGRLKWEGGLQKKLDDLITRPLNEGGITSEGYNNIMDGIKSFSQKWGDDIGYGQRRGMVRSMAENIKQFGGTERNELLKNFGAEVSKIYGQSYKTGFDKYAETAPESEWLDKEALLGYEYLKDISPEQAKQYESLFIDPKKLKNDPDALAAYNKLMANLKDTGISLQRNAINEDLNNLVKSSKVNNGLTPEQLQEAEKLETRLNTLDTLENKLNSDHPERGEDALDDATQEILGQKTGWASQIPLKTKNAVKNTVSGVWEMVSQPFMSDESNQIRELSIMGEQEQQGKDTRKVDKNTAFQTSRMEFEPELKTQLDAIKNDKSLTYGQQEDKVQALLKANKGKWGRVEIANGKLNLSPAALVGAVTDLATTLVPFIAVEAATGGIGGAGAAARFLRTANAAFLTGYHDHYAESLNKGLRGSDAYFNAMGMTAIDAAAMAGAGTVEAVKAFYKGKNISAAKVVEKLSDDAIAAQLKRGASKGMKAFGQSIKERVKATPGMIAKGAKTGAEFEVAMAGAENLKGAFNNEPVNHKEEAKRAVLGIINFSGLAAVMGHAGYKSPNSLDKAYIVDIGKQPEGYTAALEKMKSEGLGKDAYDEKLSIIEKATEAYKTLPKYNPKGKQLTETQKGDYILQTIAKKEHDANKSNLPPKQAAEAELKSKTADYVRQIILDEPTDKQLETQLAKVEKSLEPKKDADGKAIEMPEKEKIELQAEKEAITQVIEKREADIVDTKLSEPVEGLNEQDVPTEPVKEPSTVTEVELSDGNKIQWDVFGNEESGEWTVGEKTKTRGGKDAVVLSKTYVTGWEDGKTYTKEYADKNGIKYKDEHTVEHIVPLEDLQPMSVKQESKPSTVSSETTTPKGNTSNVVGGVVDLNVAQKYTINAANKDLPQAKEVDKNLIDWEASGLDEFDTEVDKVKVLETRGKNAQGQAVGTVRVYLKDGSIENFEVKFKETSKGNTSNVVEGSVGVGGDVDATAKALQEVQKTENPTKKQVEAFQKIKDNYYPKGSKVLHHGSSVEKLERDNDGLIWFTDEKKVADDYRKRSVVSNKANLDEYDADVMESKSAIETIADEQGIDLSKGKVFSGQAKMDNVIDLTDKADDGNISNLPKLWGKLHEKGLVEKWEDIDQDYRDELIDEYQGKATWRLLEGENIYDDAKKKGYDGVVISDVGIDGKIHKAYGLFNLKNFHESSAKGIAEAYHKAKEDGSNPELVKAVEQSLKETTKAETPTPKGNTSNVGGEVGRTAKAVSKRVAVEHAGYEGAKRVTGANENTLELDGYGTVSTSQFINTLVENGRLSKDALKNRHIQLTDEYATKLLNENSDLFPKENTATNKNETNLPTFESAKNEYDAVKEKYNKHLKKDGGLRANTPDNVKKEIEDAYTKMQSMVKQERDKRVSEDKRDTGLIDGIERIKDNTSAFTLVRMAMNRGVIPERQYNEFGKNLLHIIADAKDSHEVTMQTAEIIQDFSQRANVKVDDALAREIQAAENLKYEPVEQSLKETTKAENKPLTSEQDNKAGTESVEPIPTETQGEPKAEPIETGGGAEPPKEPPLADFAYKGTKKERQRALLSHLMEAKEVPEHYKKSLEKKGLDYNAASREEAADVANGIVNNLGVDNALEAARSELVHPSVGSAIYADVLNKLYAEEKAARASGDTKTADNLAQQWADVSLEYAAASTGKGQFISQIAHFYKTSPMGIIMRDKANKAERFNEWFENKEEGYKEVFDEIVKSEEGQALLKVEVEKLRKEERKSERAAKKEEVFKKVDDAVKKWTDKLTPKTMRGNDFKKQGAGAEEVLKVLGAAVKKAYEIGETIEKIIEDAKVYLKDKFDVTDKDVEAIVNDFIGGRKNKKKGTTESEKAHLKRIEYLEKELKRLEERRSKEPAEKKPSTREIPNDEQQLRDAIEAEREKWDNEKDATRQLANDYQKMETERNRQLKRVGELNDAIKILESGKLPEGQTKEAKKDTPEIEALKKEKESLEKSVRENIAHEKKMKGLETELQRLIDRKPREEKATDKAEISPEEKTIRDKIKSEREAWDKEKSRETRINNLEAELQRLKDRKAKDTNAAKKPEYDAEETRLRNEVKSEREAWQHDKVMEGLETELQRLKDRKAKEPKPESKRIISEDERLKRDEIEAEQKAWDVENNIDKLNTELQRVRNRQKKVTNPKEKKELTDTEKNIIQEIKDEKEVWAKEVEPERKLREALKATQKSLEEYERRVRDRDISKTPTNGAPETPELKALRDKRDAKKKEYDEMKKKITGENDRIESLKERAEELKTRMDNKDFSAEAYEEKAPLSEREKQALDEYKEVKKQYDEAKKKSPEYIDKKAKLYIENFRKKLKGLNEKEKEDVIRKSIKKLIDNGALKYEDFKKIIAETIGIKEFTDEQVKQIEDLTAVINKVNEVENAMVANPTRENISAYEQAQKANLQAQLDLYNITNTRSDVVGTLKAIYTGGLLGLPTLIKNVGQNVIAQWTLRLPKAIVVQLGDLGAYGIAKLKSKWIGGEPPALPNNLLLAQKGYFGNLVKGLKSAAFDFNKGVVRKDYFASTEYQSTLSPRRALKELGLWRKGELHLTKTEIADRLLKTTLGWQSDFILRGMQFGDTPQRHAAEGARAIQIAMQELGLKDSLEIEAFLQSPEKYANKVFLKQGKNAKEAGQLATEVRESIIKEGEKAVFQEDNFLSKGSEFLEKSLKTNKDDSPATSAVKNAASLVKTKTFPFIKIPANVYWSYFKAANPYLAFGLAAKDAATAKYYQKKGEIAKARAYEDKSSSNMAHGIVGMGIAAVANGWVQSGFVRASNDEKNRARETEGEKIFGKQNQLNLGKVLGSDTDYWVDLSWFGALGTILDTKARMGQEKERKKDKGEEQQGAWDDFVDNMSYSAAASLNTLVFDQAGKAVDAITGDKKQRQQYISEFIGSTENMVTGATIPSISKAILPNEVRVKGDGIWETVKNDAKYRNGIIRFFAGQPPAKISIWGEPVKKDNSITGALGNMLGFQKGNDEVFGLILYDDYQRTQNTKFFPVPEDEKITVNGKEFKLTQQETDKLKEYVGKSRKMLVEPFVYDNATTGALSDIYSSLNDTEKVKQLNKLYQMGKKIGYHNFIQEFPQYSGIDLPEE